MKHLAHKQQIRKTIYNVYNQNCIELKVYKEFSGIYKMIKPTEKNKQKV